jgi:hypothetical protein
MSETQMTVVVCTFQLFFNLYYRLNVRGYLLSELPVSGCCHLCWNCEFVSRLLRLLQTAQFCLFNWQLDFASTISSSSSSARTSHFDLDSKADKIRLCHLLANFFRAHFRVLTPSCPAATQIKQPSCQNDGRHGAKKKKTRNTKFIPHICINISTR